MSFDQVVLPVFTCPEFLITALHQTLVHVLSLGKDCEKRVMPLLYVNVKESGSGQRASTGAAHISVQGVVVVLVLLQCAMDGAAAGNVTGKLRNA